LARTRKLRIDGKVQLWSESKGGFAGLSIQ